MGKYEDMILEARQRMRGEKKAFDSKVDDDHYAAERELMMGAPPKAEDQDATAAKKADEDFSKLHQLINSTKAVGDADSQMLRTLVNDANRKRLHEALDKVLDGLRQRRRASDSKFLRRVGVRR